MSSLKQWFLDIWIDFRESEVYENYFFPPELSEKEQRQFKEHARSFLQQIFRVYCAAAILFVIATWPSDFYVYEGMDYFLFLMSLSRLTFLILCGVTIYGLSEIKLIRNYPSEFGFLILCVFGFLAGFATSNLGGLDTHAYYWIYFFPILGVFGIDMYLLKRTLFTLVATGFCLLGYFGFHPEYLDYSLAAVPLLFNTGTVLCSIVGGEAIHNLYKRTYIQGQEIERERQRAEELLLNILPEDIAGQLKNDRGLIAERYEEVTVLFADLVNFTPLAETMHTDSIVLLLDDIFSSFDQMIGSFDLEKIKTIGDEYFVVSGAPEANPTHAVEAAKFALAMQKEMRKYRYPGDEDRQLKLRIGLHTGPLVGGVIGTEKFVYDVWGDTVNTGSRMETQGVPGKVQVTPKTRERLIEQSDAGVFEFEEREPIEVKGKGTMKTFLLNGS